MWRRYNILYSPKLRFISYVSTIQQYKNTLYISAGNMNITIKTSFQTIITNNKIRISNVVEEVEFYSLLDREYS